MKLKSWNRFTTRSLAVTPSLMGRSISFTHNGYKVTIKLPGVDRVASNHDDEGLAVKGSWKADTNEVIYYGIKSVDVTVEVADEMDISNEVLKRNPNAVDIIDTDSQTTLDSLAKEYGEISKIAFEYWVSLLRYASRSHRICRNISIGSESGWSEYLMEADSGKRIWVSGLDVIIYKEEVITDQIWEKVCKYAEINKIPPLHLTLLSDALDCIDNSDYKRALVDLCVSCEVFLRGSVITNLPKDTSEQVKRVIEEANINQFVSHLFPEWLDDDAEKLYRKNIKPEISSLLDKRNKLMHVGSNNGITEENCRRYAKALESLYDLYSDSLKRDLNLISDDDGITFRKKDD